MSIKHTQTSVANKPKTLEELAADNARLGLENERLRLEIAQNAAQLTDTQVALCEIYESLGA